MPKAKATVWGYSWTQADPLFGNNAGGIWDSVSFTQDDVSNLFTAEIRMDTLVNNTEALWLSVTNGPTPDGVSGDYAGIYMDDGRLLVTRYLNSPVADHDIYAIDIISSTGTYSESTVGTMKTFSFTLDVGAINNWAGAPVGWKGFGFPYDAQGNTSQDGNLFDPYRMGAWIRSFADGSGNFVMPPTDPAAQVAWDVTWGAEIDPNIGTWDIGNTIVTPVPEPSGSLLALLSGLFFVAGRSRKKRLS